MWAWVGVALLIALAVFTVSQAPPIVEDRAHRARVVRSASLRPRVRRSRIEG